MKRNAFTATTKVPLFVPEQSNVQKLVLEIERVRKEDAKEDELEREREEKRRNATWRIRNWEEVSVVDEFGYRRDRPRHQRPGEQVYRSPKPKAPPAKPSIAEVVEKIAAKTEVPEWRKKGAKKM